MPLGTIYNKACACSDYSLPEDNAKQIEAFYQLRKMCPVLKLTIPDEIEEQHMHFSKAEPDAALHCSIPFLAYRNGYLAEFTQTFHRFVLDGNELRKQVTLQYKNDLREKWVLEINEVSRYEKARNYLSRLAELDFALWLETQHWQILDLELYGGESDIQAKDNILGVTEFEIKFLGQREVLFELIRNGAANSLGVYSPVDYLLFRLYQAAKQLQNSKTYRIAVAIVSDYEFSYQLPLSEGWIDWTNPSFLKRDSEIHDFLAKQYIENPNLDEDLKTLITGLNEIWILSYKTMFGLQLEHRILVAQM